MQKTLEQKRASYAWDCVSGISNDVKEKYCGIAKDAGMMILTNGLGQTMAFYFARKSSDKAYEDFYQHISKWLVDSDKAQIVTQAGNSQELIQAISRSDVYTYRRATLETIALLRWFRRFAEALGE